MKRAIVISAFAITVIALGVLLASAVDNPPPTPAAVSALPAVRHSVETTAAPWGHDELEASKPGHRVPAIDPRAAASVRPLPTQQPFVTPAEHAEPPPVPAEFAEVMTTTPVPRR